MGLVYQMSINARNRRAVLARAALLTVVAFVMGFAQPSILVCIPGASNTQKIQNGLDGLLGEGKGAAFGRIKDLENAAAAAPGAAIVVPAAYIDYVKGYQAVLTGVSHKKTTEKYLLVAATAGVTKENVSEKRIGIVDLLGRERLGSFVRNMFGFDPKQLKRVNKNEDLLTLLGMESVDAVIISAEQYKELLSNTKQSLTIIAESSRDVGFAVAAVKQGARADAAKKALLKGPLSFVAELGIDGWEEKGHGN
jgi:hypothetical protein